MEQEKQVLLRHMNAKYLAIIDQEAKRNNLSRSALIQIILETYAKNAEQVNATEVLAPNLQDVNQQLNQLIHAVSNSNYNINQDFNALKEVIQVNNLAIATYSKNVEALTNIITAAFRK